MRKIYVLIVIVIAILFFVSCSTAQKMDSLAVSSSEASDVMADRSIIKKATISVNVNSVEDMAKRAKEIVSSSGGYVTFDSQEQTSYYMNAKVTPAKLDSVLDEIGKLGEEEKRNQTSEDVTSRIGDLQALINNKKILRDKLRKLADASRQMADIIEMEKELSRLQTDIDSLESQLKGIQSQVEMSSISVTLKVKRTPGPLGWIFVGVYWVIEKLFIW
ncbi:MAG TPA: DUF4349 domain-containing protein [Candidatus Goldiibacteriota bacterium]|nr:DUF4349 domain-containing protein [Candidatus Goldiibacteriota bacterium]HPN64338.1 DUF4349 domain-containing protein [Candidatus Goldiibacteriota bacterium]HRQ44807.1 DUF4349 domain-containing protein [Candidatus Goldiibacteriota bacterium]